MTTEAFAKEDRPMARCEDYPCCGHTPEDPCGPQEYDRPNYYDITIPGNEHHLCNHEEGECQVDEDEEDGPEMVPCPTCKSDKEVTRHSSTGGADPYDISHLECKHQVVCLGPGEDYIDLDR
jgi:hypothetical protein